MTTPEPAKAGELQSAPDLRALEHNYEIIGELRGNATTRYYVGRHLADLTDVLVSVVDAENGGENNGLAHLASDAKILANAPHPAIARVLEGRWLGTGQFATITERMRGSTLHEVLSAGGSLPNPRISTVLQEVNGALAWARSRGVVHRGVTPESLYFDPDTNRPRIVLSLTPIPLEGLPDAAADARTIGELAWAMLAGSPSRSDADSLRDVQPPLANRVVEETTAMVHLVNDVSAPDVERFLAVIAMGDVIREGEIENERIQAEMETERHAERRRVEALERAFNERAAAVEKQLTRERVEFEQRLAREEARMASEQQRIAAERSEHDVRLASEKQQITAERSKLDLERSQFSDRVAEFELRSAIERPTANEELVPRLTSFWNDGEGVETRGRFGWLIPVGTVALLACLIVLGAMMANHRPARGGSVGGRTQSGIVAPAAKRP